IGGLGARRNGGLGARRNGGLGARRAGGLGGRRRTAVACALMGDEREYVLLAHAPAAARAANLREVYALARRDPLDDRRVDAASALGFCFVDTRRVRVLRVRVLRVRVLRARVLARGSVEVLVGVRVACERVRRDAREYRADRHGLFGL